MWTRAELKDKAKKALNNNYWKVVLVSYLVVLIAGGTAAASGSSLSTTFTEGFIEGFTGAMESEDDEYYEDEEYYDTEYYDDGYDDDLYWEGYWDGYEGEEVSSDAQEYLDGHMEGEYDAMIEEGSGFSSGDFGGMSTGQIVAVVVLMLVLVLVIAVIATAGSLIFATFIGNPFQLGAKRFYMKALNEKAEVKEIGFAFDHNFKNIAKILFFRDIQTMGWYCLFIIPGVVKSYEYLMIPYLLADNPNLTKKEAFALSKQLMKGNKFKAFILGWSFAGWALLGICTLGLLGTFYVNPYRNLTYAALYEKLSELNGHPARTVMPQSNYYDSASEDTEWTEASSEI